MSIDRECLTPRMFDYYEFTYTHKGHIFTGHIGAASWNDALEKLASARENARITANTLSLLNVKSEFNYKAAWQEFHEKTEWVQQRKNFPFPALGMHRADVMNKYIEHLEAQIQTQPVQPAGFIDTERLEVSGMTWAVREKSREIHQPFYLQPPAAAINAQLLEALKAAQYRLKQYGYQAMQKTIEKVDAAIAAAEAEAKKARGNHE